MSCVHVVVPAGLDDPSRPSGGNHYDRRVCDGLRARGWTVREHPVAGGWPHPSAADRDALSLLLSRIPDGARVLVDGLIASADTGPVSEQGERLRFVVLVHLPLGAGLTADPSAYASESTVLAAARAVVTTSRWTRQVLVSDYPLDPATVHVAAPGVDPAPGATGTPQGGELLCVAAVVPHKGHDLLLAALSDVRDRPWRLTCVGALDLAPGHVDALRRQAARSGIADRVTFLGPRTGADLQRAYAGSDVLVSASRGETFGMVVTEALAHGLPVIATEVGGLAEALGRTAHGVLPGLLVPPDDSAALARSLRSWLSDDGVRRALRLAAGERRSTLTDWSTTAEQVARVLARVA
ncbi:Group 1 glycosyl transferase protein [metagenome]|uniref:Group 1 glycosyl transferase protein n=1 Tax=metagenome TaxID=256318 RepID=A0A2P2BZZ5_9ZZZZ